MAHEKPTNRTPKKAARRTVADWAPAFLAALKGCGNVRKACETAGVCRSAAYDRRDADADFAKAWRESIADAIDQLEEVAFARAKAESDTLLIFLLKSHRPEVYRERLEVASAVKLEIVEEIVDGDHSEKSEAPSGAAPVPPV